MVQQKSKTRAFLSLEIKSFYRFPIVECFAGVFTLLALLNVLSVGSVTDFDVESPANLAGFLQSAASMLLYLSVFPFTYLLVFLVPVLVSLVIAKPFEDGTIRTILTHPIKRSSLLLTKILITVVLPGTATTIALLLAIQFGFGIQPSVSQVALLIGSIWVFILSVASVTTLLSVISKKAATSATGGVVLWYSMIFLAGLYGFPETARHVINPLSAALAYVLGGDGAPLLADVLVGLLGALSMAFVIIVVSIALFERSEV